MEKTLIAVLIAFGLVLGVGLWVSDQPEQEMSFYFGYSEKVDENWLHLDEFFFVDSIYHGLFMSYDLVEEMTIDQKAEILEKMLNNLVYEKPLYLTVKNYNGRDALKIFLVLEKDDDGEPVILLGSNLNAYTHKIIKRRSETNEAKMSVYSIKDRKTIHLMYFEPKWEEQARKENNLNNIADIYLMDDDPENDQYIVELLQQYQTEADDIEDKYIATLTLAEYYASCEDEGMFRITLADAEQMVYDNEELAYLAYHVQSIEEIYEITQFLKHVSDQ